MINATLCYVRNGDKTLMLHRVKKENDIHEGKWNGLGGKMEPGETPEECVTREVREESGLHIRDPALRGVLMFPEFDGNNDWLAFVFTAHTFTGELINSTEGILQWIDNADLLDLNLWEGDKIFLKWLERDAFFSGKFTYKKKRLIDHQVVFHTF